MCADALTDANEIVNVPKAKIDDGRVLNEINSGDPERRRNGVEILRFKYGEIMLPHLRKFYGKILSDMEIEETIEKAFIAIGKLATRKQLHLVNGTLSHFVAAVCHGRIQVMCRSQERRQKLYKKLQRSWMVSHQDPSLNDQPATDEFRTLCGAIYDRIGSQPNTRAVFEAICSIIHERGGLFVKGMDNPSVNAIYEYLRKNGPKRLSADRVKAARDRLRGIVQKVMEEQNWYLTWPKVHCAKDT